MPRSGFEARSCLVTTLNNVMIIICMISEDCRIELRINFLELNKTVDKSSRCQYRPLGARTQY
jgi:hypothetical protein